MKMVCSWSVCAMLAAICISESAAQEKKGKGEDAKFDAAKLVGTWKYVLAVKEGDKVPEEKLKDGSVVITKDTITLKSPDGMFVLKYELDAKKTPVAVKMEITEGPAGEGLKSSGIIELKGDDLKICYNPQGGDAPKAFESKEGSQSHLITLKRGK